MYQRRYTSAEQVGTRIFHIQVVSFPSKEKGVRDPRNVHVLRGTAYTGLFPHLTPDDSPRFHVHSVYDAVLIIGDLREYDYRRWPDEKLARTCIVSNMPSGKLNSLDKILPLLESSVSSFFALAFSLSCLAFLFCHYY